MDVGACEFGGWDSSSDVRMLARAVTSLCTGCIKGLKKPKCCSLGAQLIPRP